LLQFVIRELRTSDFDDIVETYFSFFPEAGADPSFGLPLFRKMPSVEDERRWFSGVLKDVDAGNLVSSVAEVNSHVIGWCDVRRVAPGSPHDHRGVLGLVVRKEFRGGGIGTALMKETIDKCRDKFESIELKALSNNLRAIKLYKRFGFRACGKLPRAVKRAGKYFDEESMYLRLQSI
jgi:RimJ/RimL family protein N-acetyltransferase